MIVFAFFTFQCEIRFKKKKKTPPKGATHFKMAHFALQNKTIKDNMKRSNITDQVNVFFFPFERIIIIVVMLCRYRRTSQDPLDDCKRNI